MINNAITMILAHGREALLAKIDVKHAFRNILVHPDDRALLSTVLPFGLRSAPKIFSVVADALQWITIHAGVSALIHYLNDFLTVGAPGLDECLKNLDTILRICNRLGVPLKLQKIEGLAAIVVFLVILLDTLNLEIRLHPEKLDHLRDLLHHWRGCRSSASCPTRVRSLPRPHFPSADD